MAELQKKVEKKDAKALFDYATGLYNISWYGNSWLMGMDNWSSADLDLYNYYKKGEDNLSMFFPDDTSFVEEYFTARIAKDYYLQAMDAFKDKEMKARCCFLAAKCQQKELNLYDSTAAIYDRCFILEQFRAKFFGTSYYDKVTKECSLFDKYVAYKTGK
jgi:hypothetical protein